MQNRRGPATVIGQVLSNATGVPPREGGNTVPRARRPAFGDTHFPRRSARGKGTGRGQRVSFVPNFVKIRRVLTTGVSMRTSTGPTTDCHARAKIHRRPRPTNPS